MLVFIILLWSSFFLLAWTFIGYPLAALTLVRFFAKPWPKEKYTGSVTMIIAAHNEEEVIRAKVENCLALDFGEADSQIIIVSDGSTDDTNLILEEFAQRAEYLELITYQPRSGKAHALNVGVSKARGEILIFGDANVMVAEKSCQHLLAPFVDPEVGVVCARVWSGPGRSRGCWGEPVYEIRGSRSGG